MVDDGHPEAVTAALGEAGRVGVQAALLARAGMTGPEMPFEGGDGWLDRIAGRRFEPPVMGGGDEPFRIEETFVKQRPSCAWTIASVLAPERAHARLTGRTDIARVVVETYRIAKRRTGTGEHQWHPRTRETADHPYSNDCGHSTPNPTWPPSRRCSRSDPGENPRPFSGQDRRWMSRSARPGRSGR